MLKLRAMSTIALLSATAVLAENAPPAAADDPYLWLEDVNGERALEWARAQNARSQAELEHAPDFENLRQRLLSIYDSKARIPAVAKRGELYYNFWRDAQHVRGLWRRTTLEEFRKPEPAQGAHHIRLLADAHAFDAIAVAALDHRNVESALPQRDRCRETANAAADDEDPQLFHAD